MGEHGITWESNTLLNLDYADNLSVLDERQNECFFFGGGGGKFRVQKQV